MKFHLLDALDEWSHRWNLPDWLQNRICDALDRCLESDEFEEGATT